jgi:hypothetical protein
MGILNGINCIRVTFGDPNAGHQSYWFDPNRGHALLAYEHINIKSDRTRLTVASDRVTKLEEIAPGIW